MRLINIRDYEQFFCIEGNFVYLAPLSTPSATPKGRVLSPTIYKIIVYNIIVHNFY
jgi:hypothetical protein